jgi:hypothetical protein
MCRLCRIALSTGLHLRLTVGDGLGEVVGDVIELPKGRDSLAVDGSHLHVLHLE